MIERLADLGFTDVAIVGRRVFVDKLNDPDAPPSEKVVVRALHPVHGWMYEKFAPGDVAAIEAWAGKVNAKIVKDQRIGAIDEAMNDAAV